MARELEKLRAELANADKGANVAASGGNPGYGGNYGNPEAGYAANPYLTNYGMNPIPASVESFPQYGPGPGSWAHLFTAPFGTALIKLVCLATFLNVSENDSFDPYQELLKALIGFIDVVGLYFALTQLTHRNISQNHEFQAIGLGWAFADSVLHRLAPLWVGARGLEFTWDHILQGLEANANLVLRIVATMLSITSYLRRGLGWHLPKEVGFELFTSLVMAFISWQLFATCQRPST
ncbi:transmembrane protein 147-like [Vitis riparia]|uniref:transmembrane protein 147-like n=1 Tax=Vitis riparia TaxID=96939 RepID=UPI00155A1DA2|nr:transmembrane protein 147-like [Vitis riparia]